MKLIKKLAIILILTSMFLVGCGEGEQLPPGWQLEPSPTGGNEVPTNNPGNDEARVRYILADIQLGGVSEYYRQFTDDPVIVEALARWDVGVRVQNIDEFKRKIVGDKGWQVVYAGTDEIIYGMDVILTTDIASEIPTTGGVEQSQSSEYWPACPPPAPLSRIHLGDVVTFATAAMNAPGNLLFSQAPGRAGRYGDIYCIKNYFTATVVDGPVCTSTELWWKIQPDPASRCNDSGWTYEFYVHEGRCSNSIIPGTGLFGVDEVVDCDELLPTIVQP